MTPTARWLACDTTPIAEPAGDDPYPCLPDIIIRPPLVAINAMFEIRPEAKRAMGEQTLAWKDDNNTTRFEHMRGLPSLQL